MVCEGYGHALRGSPRAVHRRVAQCRGLVVAQHRDVRLGIAEAVPANGRHISRLVRADAAAVGLRTAAAAEAVIRAVGCGRGVNWFDGPGCSVKGAAEEPQHGEQHRVGMSAGSWQLAWGQLETRLPPGRCLIAASPQAEGWSPADEDAAGMSWHRRRAAVGRGGRLCGLQIPQDWVKFKI